MEIRKIDGKYLIRSVVDLGYNQVIQEGVVDVSRVRVVERKITFSRPYAILSRHTRSGTKNIIHVASIPYLDQYGLFVFSRALEMALPLSKWGIANKIEEADVVYIHQVGPIHIPKEFEGKKLIMQFHGFVPENFREYKDMLDELVFISKYQKDKIFGCRRGKVIYNPILPFERLDERRIYHFIFAQSDYKEKNPEWVKENVRKYLMFNVAIAGKIRVDGAHNFGYQPIEKLHRLHAQSEIFVMPSTKEAFGLAPLYAMLQGCVPAVTIHSGAAEIIPDKISIKFDPEDTTLRDIWEEYQERKLWKYRDEIREFALSFSPERYVKNVDRIIEEVEVRR